MALIKNNIEIEGVQQRDGITEGTYVLNYWENGPIFLPKSKGKIKYLNKVIIEMDSVEGKILNTPGGKVLSIYGRKIYSLIYSEKSHDRSQRTSLNLPFVAYAYLPAEVDDIKDLEVSVLDAFFEVIDNRKVHNHILYLIKFNKKDVEVPSSDVIETSDGQLTLSDLERMIQDSSLNQSSSDSIETLETPEIKLLENKEEVDDNITIINNDFIKDTE